MPTPRLHNIHSHHLRTAKVVRRATASLRITGWHAERPRRKLGQAHTRGSSPAGTARESGECAAECAGAHARPCQGHGGNDARRLIRRTGQHAACRIGWSGGRGCRHRRHPDRWSAHLCVGIPDHLPGAVLPAQFGRHLPAPPGGGHAPFPRQAPGHRYLATGRGRYLVLPGHHHRDECIGRHCHRLRDVGPRSRERRALGGYRLPAQLRSDPWSVDRPGDLSRRRAC